MDIKARLIQNKNDWKLVITYWQKTQCGTINHFQVAISKRWLQYFSATSVQIWQIFTERITSVNRCNRTRLHGRLQRRPFVILQGSCPTLASLQPQQTKYHSWELVEWQLFRASRRSVDKARSTRARIKSGSNFGTFCMFFCHKLLTRRQANELWILAVYHA